MIRVSVFSKDLMLGLCLGWQGLVYIAQSIKHEPLDQINLRNDVDAT